MDNVSLISDHQYKQCAVTGSVLVLKANYMVRFYYLEHG